VAEAFAHQAHFESAGITFEARYWALRPDRAPRFATVWRVYAALGGRLVAQPIHG
jgi:DNA-binding phage protein